MCRVVSLATLPHLDLFYILYLHLLAFSGDIQEMFLNIDRQQTNYYNGTRWVWDHCNTFVEHKKTLKEPIVSGTPSTKSNFCGFPIINGMVLEFFVFVFSFNLKRFVLFYICIMSQRNWERNVKVYPYHKKYLPPNIKFRLDLSSAVAVDSNATDGWQPSTNITITWYTQCTKHCKKVLHSN